MGGMSHMKVDEAYQRHPNYLSTPRNKQFWEDVNNIAEENDIPSLNMILGED